MDFFGRDKFKALDVTEREVELVELHGILRGVQKIDFGKLTRALTMRVIELTGNKAAEPNFLVIPTDSEGTDVNGRARKRGTQWADYYPEDPEGEYVCIYDRDVDRCHCSDFIWRGETEKSPCAHILAALVHIKHPGIMPFVAELAERNRLAEAVVA